MTTDWPRSSPNAGARRRATLSLPPPAENGTTSVMGLVGQSGAAKARPEHERKARPAMTMEDIWFMDLPIDGKPWPASVASRIKCRSALAIEAHRGVASLANTARYGLRDAPCAALRCLRAAYDISSATRHYPQHPLHTPPQPPPHTT